jgi:Fe-S cluster assembly protein SufD
VGQLDFNALFYLRSRGLPLERARRLLVHAFASAVLERVELPALRSELNELLSRKLEEGGA